MKAVTMSEFRKDAEGILRRVGKGERFVLSYRGRPAARLEPITAPALSKLVNDPFLTIGRRAVPSPKGKTPHAKIDHILADCAFRDYGANNAALQASDKAAEQRYRKLKRSGKLISSSGR